VATLGWNMLSDWKQSQSDAKMFSERRSATLQAIAAEMATNRKKLDYKSFLETDPEKLQRADWYPRMQSVALETAITSGLFDSAQDRPLLSAIYDIHTRMSMVDTMVAHTEGPQLTVVDVKRTRDSLREIRDAALIEFQQFENLLKQKYGIDANAKFFEQWQDTSKSHTY
jgi:hypothetical protein